MHQLLRTRCAIGMADKVGIVTFMGSVMETTLVVV